MFWSIAWENEAERDRDEAERSRSISEFGEFPSACGNGTKQNGALFNNCLRFIEIGDANAKSIKSNWTCARTVELFI